jgi:hypothetical protein
MGRNNKEIELFDEKFILSERDAIDVLSFSEFVKNNSNDTTIGIALYQAALIVESALKYNRKEIPNLPKSNILKKVLRFFELDKEYKKIQDDIEKTLEYNSKILSSYILSKLTQIELFELMKEVYVLEGANFDSTEETIVKKKN